MNYIVAAVVIGIVVTLIILAIYKYGLDPLVVYKPNTDNMAKCPDRWNYSPISKRCIPAYKTNCLPFDPDDSTLNSLTERCNLARKCGTEWSGFCG